MIENRERADGVDGRRMSLMESEGTMARQGADELDAVDRPSAVGAGAARAEAAAARRMRTAFAQTTLRRNKQASAAHPDMRASKPILLANAQLRIKLAWFEIGSGALLPFRTGYLRPANWHLALQLFMLSPHFASVAQSDYVGSEFDNVTSQASCVSKMRMSTKVEAPPHAE
jgi:hypothetical protein